MAPSTYKPPAYTILRAGINELNKHLSANAHCYQPQSLTRLLELVHSEIIKNYKPKSNHREQQAQVFNLLHAELTVVDRQNDPAKKEEAVKFLLGALIYRYLRIQAEYTRRPDGVILSLFGSKPENCGLYRAITRVLQLSNENPLDAMTIVSCCESFKQNISDLKRFSNYTYFNQDSEFFNHLNEIQSRFKIKAGPVLQQFDAVKFLQSLVREVESAREGIEKVLDDAFYDLTSEKNAEPLTLNVLTSHLDDTIENKVIKQRMSQLLSAKYVVNNFDEELPEQGRQMLNQWLIAKSNYVLLGACLILLGRSNDMFELKQSIQMVLGASEHSIETAYHKAGINALHDWLLIDDNLNLDCTTWNNFEIFKAEVIRQQSNLNAPVDESKRTSAIFMS